MVEDRIEDSKEKLHGKTQMLVNNGGSRDKIKAQFLSWHTHLAGIQDMIGIQTTFEFLV